MDQLSVYDILSLIRTNEEAVSTQFQVWLTITFSTIVAVFAGRDILTQLIRGLVSLLYCLASLATLASGIYLAENTAKLSVELSTRGVSYAPPVFASVSYLLLFFAGLITTVYFIQLKTGDTAAS